MTSRPSSSTLPVVGKSKPVITFTSVVLPAPFGPIKPDDLVPAELEVDVDQRVDAVEGAGDADRPQHPGRSAFLRFSFCHAPR